MLHVDEHGRFELPSFESSLFTEYLRSRGIPCSEPGQLENLSDWRKAQKAYEDWGKVDQDVVFDIPWGKVLKYLSLAFAITVGWVFVHKNIPKQKWTPPRRVEARDKVSIRIDQILKTLQFGNVAYSAPKSMQFDDEASVKVSLSPSGTLEQLKAKLLEDLKSKEGTLVYRVDATKIRVADEMEAKLFSRGFEIQPITSERQAVSETEDTKWEWLLKPKEWGRQELRLTVSVIMGLDGKQLNRALKVFDYEINVNVSGVMWAWHFAEKNWEYIITSLVAIGSVLCTWGWPWLKKLDWARPFGFLGRLIPKHGNDVKDAERSAKSAQASTKQAKRKDRRNERNARRDSQRRNK